MIDMLKRQAFFIACGLAGIAGIALGVTGIARLKHVGEQMEQAVKLQRELSGMRGGAVNQKFIEVEQTRIEEQMKNYRELLNKARSLQPYKPLMDNFFPAPPPDSDERNLKLEFRKRYQQAFAEMFARLNSGRPASVAEVQQAADEIALERRTATALNTTAPAPDEEGEYTPAGVLTKTGARVNPNARANLEKAQKIDCYAEPSEATNAETQTFEFHPRMRGVSRLDELTMKDCWEAQLSLWIQQDIVDALVRVNQQTKDELIARGQSPWVGVLPVKDIISLRISSEFVGPATDESSENAPRNRTEPAMPQGWAPAKPVGLAEVSFGNRFSGPDSSFDVLQFTLKMVIDQRDLLRIIREISAQRFHTLIRCAYIAQMPDPSMQTKIYGAEPVIKVVLDFETSLLAEEYRRLMPDEVLEYYGYQRPGGSGKED